MNKLEKVKEQVLIRILKNKKTLEEMCNDETIPAEARICIRFSLGALIESELTLEALQ